MAITKDGTNYYNEKLDGRISEDFLKEVVSDAKKSKKQYVIIEGYFNQGQLRIPLEKVLNEMYSLGYEFVQFVSINERSVYGELLFKSLK